MHDELTRREALRRAGAGIGAATVMSNSLIAKALAAAPRCGTLGEIEHVVILIQENRSFDHYFGSYRGVRGFADPNVGPLGDGSGLSIFAQPGYPGGFDGGHLYPFHLDSDANGECTNDIDHSWGPQHSYWNGGELDGFVSGHLAVDGASNGPLTMGYYTRNDLSLYYALADAFTICDRYFCSVIGPTDPNRLYSFSATLDPAGAGGGPIPSADPARRHARRVAHRHPAAVGCRRCPRADRARIPRADARRLAVQPRRLRLRRHVRPHLAAAVHRDAVRRGGPQPHRLETIGDGRPHERVQLREPR